MTHFPSLAGLAILLVNVAIAAPTKTSIYCNTGKLVPEFEVHFDFRTDGPSMIETTINRDKNGKPTSQSKKVLLAANNVCGVNLDFAKQCTVRENNIHDDYYYEFKCAGGYGGYLEFQGRDDGFMSFRCRGPKVDVTNQDFFHNSCKLTKS